MRDSRMRRVSQVETNDEGGVGVETGAGFDSGILYIDGQCLTRDCISDSLSNLLSPLRVTAAISAQDFAPDNSAGKTFALAVLHIHAASVRDSAVATEMSRLREVVPHVPIALLGDK